MENFKSLFLVGHLSYYLKTVSRHGKNIGYITDYKLFINYLYKKHYEYIYRKVPSLRPPLV